MESSKITATILVMVSWIGAGLTYANEPKVSSSHGEEVITIEKSIPAPTTDDEVFLQLILGNKDQIPDNNSLAWYHRYEAIHMKVVFTDRPYDMQSMNKYLYWSAYLSSNGGALAEDHGFSMEEIITKNDAVFFEALRKQPHLSGLTCTMIGDAFTLKYAGSDINKNLDLYVRKYDVMFKNALPSEYYNICKNEFSKVLNKKLK